MAKADRVRVTSLEHSPSHLLHGALQLALDVYGEALGAGALTQRQFAVLAAVSERDGLSQTDLVGATGVDRSTLADMVARMITKGLLDRARSATDARANTVRLTDAGREALDAARPRVEAADARILALLSSGKREGFVNQLRTLARANEAVALGEAAPSEAAPPVPKKKAKETAKLAKTDAKPAKADKKKRKKARKAEQQLQREQPADPIAPDQDPPVIP